MVTFWGHLHDALAESEPDLRQIRPKRTLERADFDPKNPKHHLDINIIEISEGQLNSLTKMHHNFTDAIKNLAPTLPFEKGAKGIVMTANPKLLGVALTSLLMIRRTGSSLPVEIFLSDSSDHSRDLCNQALADLNARCLNIEEFLRLPSSATATRVPELVRYQFKAFSLIFSSFQSVLFLDADAFPIHNPDHLLSSEPFLSHGLVTFPDFWVPTISPLFWSIASTTAPDISTSSRATEAGVMLYDKLLHADSLLLAAYYNLYGPATYYWLQSQGAWGTGDKETFRLSATVLGKPGWHVGVGPEMMSVETVHDGSGMKQLDPAEDWARHVRDAEKAATKEAGSNSRDEKTDSSTPRWMFAHTNRVKIDSRRLSETLEYARDSEGKWVRLWGAESGPLVNAAGYDLEKAVWEEIINADCSRSNLEVCEHLHDFYTTIFTTS